jgi:hypothetical protein
MIVLSSFTEIQPTNHLVADYARIDVSGNLTITGTRFTAAPTQLKFAILQVHNVEIVKADHAASRSFDRGNASLQDFAS